MLKRAAIFVAKESAAGLWVLGLGEAVKSLLQYLGINASLLASPSAPLWLIAAGILGGLVWVLWPPRKASTNGGAPVPDGDTPGAPRINVEIKRLTIDKITDPDDPRVVAWLLVSNDGKPTVIEDWQMFFRYGGEERQAGKQPVFEGWVLNETPLPSYPGENYGIWGGPEYIDRRTSIAVGARAIEGFFYAKLHNAQGFAERDAATVFFRYTSMHRTFQSDSVPPGNIRWGTIVLRALGM